MNPLEVYQQAIDIVSRAVLADDFETYATCFDFPYLIRTADTHFVAHGPDDLEETFRTVARALARRGVTHYERIARDAEYVRPDRIVGWHFTHMMRDGVRIIAPHASSQILVLRNGRWLATEANYPLLTADWPPSEAAIFGPKGYFESPLTSRGTE